MRLAPSRRSPLSPRSLPPRSNSPAAADANEFPTQRPRPSCVTFNGAPVSPTARRLHRQFSTSKPDPGDKQHQSSSRKNYPSHVSRSYELAGYQSGCNVSSSSSHSRHNSYPTRRNRYPVEEKQQQQELQQQRRSRPRPPPLNLTATLWDSGQTSETDCSSSPPRSAASSSAAASSPSVISSPSASPRLAGLGNHSPRSVDPTNLYFSLPPLSPIPHSPQPLDQRRTSSPFRRTPPPSPRSPASSALSSSSPLACQSPAAAAPVGNLARLASRRRSQAVPGMRRRTSNFLELPVSDYERQRRYCSLPEHGYNPRMSNEIYRLRAFSISPKGALIKHGDQLASRRSRSSAGSTANTSRQASRSPSRGPSPYASHSGSRDVSPLARSPVGGPPSVPRSSSRQSGLLEEERQQLEEEDEGDDDQDDSVKYRVCILGQNASGKTALVNQVLTSEYMNTYDASLDEEFGERSVSVVLDGEESELVFIDHTHGEMSVENTLSTYAPHACVIVYSVVDRASFQLAEEILGYLWRVSYAEGGRASVILVGNKVDLERSRVIQQEEGKKLAMSFGAKFIETSAGLQHNVDELLVGVLKQIRLRLQQQQSSSSTVVRGASRSNSSSSPLHTLQVARDILARVCLNAKQASVSKSCENLHVL